MRNAGVPCRDPGRRQAAELASPSGGWEKTRGGRSLVLAARLEVRSLGRKKKKWKRMVF